MELMGLLLFTLVCVLVVTVAMRHTRPAHEARQLESR